MAGVARYGLLVGIDVITFFVANETQFFGSAGHILITRAVADNLNQLGGWAEYLHDLGEIKVKHGVPLHVFNLYSNEFGNSLSPERVDHAMSAPVTVGIAASGNDANVR